METLCDVIHAKQGLWNDGVAGKQPSYYDTAFACFIPIYIYFKRADSNESKMRN